MTKTLEPVVATSHILLHFQPVLNISEDQFFQFCQINRDLRIERTVEGDVIVMPPTGGSTSNRNARLTARLFVWAEQDGTGAVCDATGGFILPNGAMRSPDASWVARERLAPLTPEQKTKFLPLCPDFVVELRSPSDSLAETKDKMQEYLDNGARLGWLIDPETRSVYVYRPGAEVERLDGAETLDGGDVLPGFTLDLGPIWEPSL